MDYWPRLQLVVHDDEQAFAQAVGSARMWLFSTKGRRSLWEADFTDGDWLVLGNETQGLPEDWLAAHRRHVLRIPQASGERCLNLSTAAGIVLYEAMRQIAR